MRRYTLYTWTHAGIRVDFFIGYKETIENMLVLCARSDVYEATIVRGWHV